MSTNRGIFESFPNQPATRPDSPFAVVPESEAAPAASPFTAVARQESPFTVVDDAAEARQVEPGRPAKVPERRKAESPFQVAEPTEGFGFEAPAKPYASPFEVAPAAAAAPASPFSAPAQQPAASPFAAASAPASPATQAAIAAFSNWQDAPAAATPAPAPAPAPAAFAQQAPAAFAPAQAAPAQVPAAFAPAPQAAAPAHVPAPATSEDPQSDSFSIRQLELRAIFGVDREMNTEEILQRSRALPGIRNIARVNPQDMATIEALKTLLPNLGFGSGGLKLYSGSVPLEFIREGQVMLAVQTDGGFAPGVRETLMLVARELGRLS
ncbi:MAG: hypothetical protein EOP88_17290 [Verrucomicrobiaceae bacterium]|nr:MAG: hypothetical protein EOP88_17290 [Verrucomicrobiaceae bacterium]